MSTETHLANKTLHLLVAVLILLTSVPMSASVAAASDSSGDVAQAEAPAQQKRLEPGIRLYAVCDPPAVEPGAQVTCTVTVFNEDDEDAIDLKLSARLPKELLLAEGGRRWNGAVESLAMGESVDFKLMLEVNGDAAGPLSFEIEARGKGGVHATTTAIVGMAGAEAAQVDRLGGQFDGKDGRIRVHFPPGALKKEAKVKAQIREQEIDPLGRAKDKAKDEEADGRTGKLLRFSLEAEDAATGEDIHQFDAPVTLELDLRGLVPPEGLLPGQHLYLINVIDAEAGETEDVPFEYDPETGVMTAKLEHFSDYDAGTVGEGWQPMVILPVSDLFSGAVSYNYPIAVPAGRNGLQPNLSISYSSRRLDGLLGGQGKLDSSPLPLGWSVGGIPEIVRSTERETVAFTLKDLYTLSLNGTSHELKPASSNQTCGRYYVEDAPGIYVQRFNNSSGCGNGTGSNDTSDYWIVRTPDGTEYRMGYTINSEVSVYDSLKRTICYGYCSGTGGYKTGGVTKLGAYRWRVDQVIGPLGDRMAFSYREKTVYPDTYIHTSRSAPAFVQYNYNGTAYLSQVQSVFKSDDPDRGDFMRVLRFDVINSGQTIRRYTIDAGKKTWDVCSETYEVWQMNAIQELGWDGTPLPADTFEHVTLYNKPGGCYPYRRVSAVNTRYGGRVEIDYVSDGRYVDDYPKHGYSYRVSQMRTYDGIHNPQYGKVAYQYGTACYDQTGTSGRPCKQSPDPESAGGLVGHDWVKETVWDYDNTVLGHNVHDYYICPDNNPANCTDWKVGRELLAQTYTAPDQATLLTESRTDWANAPFGPNVDLVQMLQSISTEYSGGAGVSSRTTYKYDAYGNVTTEYQYGERLTNSGFELGMQGWTLSGSPVSADATRRLTNDDIHSMDIGTVGAAGSWSGAGDTFTVLGSGADIWTDKDRFHYVYQPLEGDGTIIARVATIQNTHASAKAGVMIRETLDQGSRHAMVAVTPSSGVQMAWRPNKNQDTYATTHSWYAAPLWVKLVRSGNTFTGYRSADGTNWVQINSVTIGMGTTVYVGLAVTSHVYGTLCTATFDSVRLGQEGWTFVEPFDGRSTLRIFPTSANGGAYQDVGGLVAGETYTVTARVKATAGTTRKFRFVLNDTTGGNSTQSPDYTPTTSWAERSWTYTANATGKMRLHLYSLAGSGSIHVDEVSLTRVGGTSGSRSIHRFYYNLTDSGRWLIGLKWGENIFEGITTNGCFSSFKTQTLWYYDYYDTAAPPGQQGSGITKGQVTAVGSGMRPNPGCSYTQGQPFALTDFTYDNWGNVASTTDANDNTSTIQYDSTYHMYPKLSCSPEVPGVGQLCTTTQYYGIDGMAADHGLPGQVKKVWGANGPDTATEYRYDAFGRLTHVKAPGDPSGWEVEDVSTWFNYVALGTMGQQRIVVKKGHGTTWQEEYFDGLGRTIQVHQKADGGQEVRTSTQYDALGRTVKQWTPYYGTHGQDGGYGAYGYVPPAGGLPYTQTSYDTLGRISVVTVPDGTQTHHYYGIDNNGSVIPNPTGLWLHSVVDGNGHAKSFVQDAFGRLVVAREFEGTAAPYTLYAETTYEYDALDHLTQVTDETDNVTTMHYDGLGRKDWMDDPDMGHWDYGYDLLGNLTSQEDAKGQTLTFVYDELNRLVSKSANGQELAGYEYDCGDGTCPTGNCGLGRRTGMSDSDGSGSTAWVYDVRGRVVTETKTIDTQTFKTEYIYDTMDRVVQMKYPGDGEVITYDYNDSGALESLSGYDPYVQKIDYNPMGQITSMRLGNDVTTHYIYDPFNFRLEHVQTADLFNLSYTYDDVGNVRTIYDSLQGEIQRFDYDALDRLTEFETADVSPASPAIDFESYQIKSYAASTNQDQNPTVTIEDGGATLHIVGNGWKKIDFPYNVTSNTVLEFDFKSGTEAEIQGIGLDNNDDQSAEFNFQLYGTQTWGIQEYNNYDSASELKHYRIPVGRYYTGNMLYLFFVHDHDVTNPTGESIFSNIRVYEDNTTKLNFGSYQIKSYANQDQGPTVTIENGGATLHIVGNGWKKIDFPYSVTLNTVIEFDFKSGVQGEIHGIGFDNDDVQSDGYAFQLYGTQTWGNQDFNDYAGDESGWKHYVIPVGEFYTGNMLYLFFVHDHDVSGPTAESFFSNIRVYERAFGTQREYAYDKIGNITHKDGMGDYVYGDPDHVHAVTHIDNQPRYTYDDNGNMTTRVVVSGTQVITYLQEFNAENKLAVVTNTVSGEVTTFIYDGDGNQVKKVENGVTTYYVGGYYEKTGSTVTKYYYAGSQRVAMRKAGVVTYLHGDHLGSTSLTTNASGNFVARVLYYPYGEERYVEGTLTTDYGFTGQRKDSYTQLTAMGARWYDAQLGRWISADTIVPEPGNPQSLNRFAYVYNNPCRYRDPNGHCGENLDLGDIDTCARFNDIEQARQFYEGVDLYLTILEYEHDTTLEFLRDLFLSGGTEMGIGMLIAEFGVSEATAGIAGDFIMGVRDEANDEGIKDLRRFRDDLGQAVSSWQEHIDSGLIDEAAGESMYMTISVRRNAINPDSYTVRLMHRHKLDSERAKYNFSDYENLIQDEFSLSAGGPFGGRVNNFGKTASALMIVGIPSEQIGGHVTKYGWVGNMRTYDTNGSALFWR